jgi:enamine deaminase RidA (YjgF/YER057c/UK114 family)
MTPYGRLKQLGLELLTPAVPVANYVPFVFANGFLYLSGQGPRKADGSQHTGKVGADVTVEQAYLHAQLTGLNLLSVAHMALGDLGRVRRVVKVLGMVNGNPPLPITRRSLMAALTCSSTSLARSANTPGQQWAWARCPVIFRSKSRSFCRLTASR